LKEVCNYNLKNPHKNMWELKPEYRHYKEPVPAPASTDDWECILVPTSYVMQVVQWVAVWSQYNHSVVITDLFSFMYYSKNVLRSSHMRFFSILVCPYLWILTVSLTFVLHGVLDTSCCVRSDFDGLFCIKCVHAFSGIMKHFTGSLYVCFEFSWNFVRCWAFVPYVPF
jgi:hypothetical protein